MRVTIIPGDGFVSVDGRGFHNLNLSSIDPQIHAVQWNGVDGEVELLPDADGKVENIFITDISLAQSAIDAWQAAADAEDAPALPTPIADLIVNAQTRIDDCAGKARLRFVSGGALIDQEYKEAEQAARDFLANTTAVPQLIQDEAARNGVSPEAAAAVIVARADALRGVLAAIRKIRLDGKALISACAAADPAAPTQAEIDAVATAERATIDALNTITPTVTGS